MAGHGLGRAAAAAVAGFLKGHLPWEEEGWYDHASTAFQIGCEALVALGQAEARDWGRRPCPHRACLRFCRAGMTSAWRCFGWPSSGANLAGDRWMAAPSRRAKSVLPSAC